MHLSDVIGNYATGGRILEKPMRFAEILRNYFQNQEQELPPPVYGRDPNYIPEGNTDPNYMNDDIDVFLGKKRDEGNNLQMGWMRDQPFSSEPPMQNPFPDFMSDPGSRMPIGPDFYRNLESGNMRRR